jgi:hypothetical protein
LKQQAIVNGRVTEATKHLEDIRTTKRVAYQIASRQAPVRKTTSAISGVTRAVGAAMTLTDSPKTKLPNRNGKRYAPLGVNKRSVYRELRASGDFVGVAELMRATSLTQNQVNSVIQDGKERGEVQPNGSGAGTRYKILPKGLQKLAEDEATTKGEHVAA